MEETHQHLIQEINPIFGQIGHIFILTAFVTAIFAAYMYFRSVQTPHPDRKVYFSKLGRGFFIGHAIALLSVVVTMFIPQPIYA
jgi:cytochrome c-type biogenesis protein CcmF